MQRSYKSTDLLTLLTGTATGSDTRNTLYTYTAHCTLYTTYYTLHTIHYTLHTTQ